ncbi:MAG: plb1 [Bacteriovoracaceae bacterium]|nr:plb1 [Bacteriovoracaceae bacterium]
MTGFIRVIIFFLLLTPFVYADPVEQVPLPSAMAVLGDSISEGLMSEFSIERAPGLLQVISMIRLVSGLTGIDRINVFRKEYAKSEHSWSTGTDDSDIVFSHLERLQTARPDIKGFNFAISGTETKNLMGQIDKFLEVEDSQNILIDYVTLLIGANDLWGTQLEEIVSPLVYAGHIESALRRLLEKNPNRMILIVGLPHVHDLFEKSSELVALDILGHAIKCQDMRTNIYGDAIIFKPKDPNYQATKLIVALYQKGLEEVAARLRSDYPKAHVKAIHDYDIPGVINKTLSADCFHPSLWGQAMLAEGTWRHGFWPDLVTDDMSLSR